MTRPVLYVAGPYSADPVICTRTAILTATAIYQHTQFVPFVPHLSHYWHGVTPMSYEDWLTIDLAVLHRCSAITRLPGESSGADREMAFALQYEIPVIAFDTLPQAVTDAYRMANGVLA